MPRFTVRISRDVTEGTRLTVGVIEAEAARSAAFAKSHASTGAVGILDEGTWKPGDD